ncbi:helix-turn-helix domain-containing protein [Aurantimonas aggregata]|uniref:Helix-turn-helix domain-containing protein n=1 Tax=Aurantimonas aggregata TaxID=2047720 RepID=A0A6L9MIL2_9HYPH|nr:AraC family transcriptional regulator [Aurantimonas aggregata]NDV87724.1 helix-turn-helix domain-containing protein [Aurantimonas aggregata]
MNTLLDAIRHHADTHGSKTGMAPTPIAGLSTVRAVRPSGLLHDISRPLVCLVVQGSKAVTLGTRQFAFSAGESLLITADVPTVSQVTRASSAAPYYSLVMELDRTVIAELAVEMRAVLVSEDAAVRVDPTDAEVADAALRLMRLLERPRSVPILQAQLMREMHYWLLAGRHGQAIRQLGTPDSHVARIARSVAVIRSAYAQPLSIRQLAAEARMGPSSFHQHFRAVTSLSPLQFQKQLRLIEARRLMMSEGVSASAAAYAVGYESVPQFTREYGRLFGLPPVRDTKADSSEGRRA